MFRQRFGRVVIATLFVLINFVVGSAFAAKTYTDNGNGTVTDPTTGLTWMRCLMGQTLSSGTCAGTVTSYSWDQAKALDGTVRFAGLSDWRLPNIRELQTIVDRTAVGPATDRVAFPDLASFDVWSSLPSATLSTYAWRVFFTTAPPETLAAAAPTSACVLCVADSLLAF